VRLVFTPRARRDLQEAFDFIAADDRAAALRQVDLVEAAAHRLRDLPLLGAPMPQGGRRLQVPRTPFRLIYRVSDDEVVVLRVWHGARQWPPARD
jgi:addiction module RelE/StbE family toxin